MPDFTEVAPRVWVAHYDWMHVNITLVGGSDGLVMVDTHGSAAQARIVADDVRRLGAGPLIALVNTHEHWDHHFGNATMVEQFGDDADPRHRVGARPRRGVGARTFESDCDPATTRAARRSSPPRSSSPPTPSPPPSSSTSATAPSS